MGQKRLEKAITTFPSSSSTNNGHTSPTSAVSSSTQINVEWRPYLIDPNTNPSGEEFEAYNQRRWGSSGWTNQLKSEGRKDGAHFQKWDWWPNTINAHCLIKFAKEQHNVETSKCNSALFNALYEEGKNISLVDVLVQVGKDDLNLPEDGLKSYLESKEGVSDVRKEIAKGQRQYQISGVPFFIIEKEGSDDPPYGLSGAQKSQTFVNVFENLCEE